MEKNKTDNSKQPWRRAAIVDALNKSIEIFTTHDEKTFEGVMTNGIRPIAEAVGIDRVVFYRRLDIDGGMRFGQIFRWDKAEGGLVSLDDELKVLPETPLMKRWISILSNGGTVRIRASDMTEDELAFSNIFGIKSIVIMSVFTHGQFWGGICFQDHTNDRYFDEDCADLLHSAVRLYANAIVRADLEQNAEKAIEALKRRERMARTLSKASLLFLSQIESTFEETMTAGVRLLVDVVDVDRFSIWRNTMMSDGLHASQVYRWDRDSGGTTQPTRGLEDITYARFAPRWEELLAGDEIVNSPSRLLPEAAMLGSFGVLSAFVTPIFFNNVFWGFVLLEDRKNERYFDADSVEMMRSAASLCTTTIISAEMERKIANANELNHTLINAAPFGITIFDETLRFTDFNEAILNAYGGSKEQFVNNFNDFSPEYQADGSKSAEKIVETMKRTLGGERMIYEWMHRSVTGELIPFEITTTRVKYNEKYIGVAFQYDLRNIRKMEKEITEAEELTRLMTESSPISYVLFDENFGPINCNEIFMKLLGCPDKQYFLEHYWDTFVPELQSDGKNSFKRVSALTKKLSANEQTTFEWLQRSIDGEMIPMENTLTHIVYKGKKYFITFKYDLRNIKKMSESIQEQSELLKVKLEQQELITEISRGFISSGDSETYINEALAKVGHYHKVSHVIIFGLNSERSHTYQAYFWSANNEPLRRFNFDLMFLIKSYFPERLPDCSTLPIISCPDIGTSPVKSFAPLLDININAFICAPLYVESRLWGIFCVLQNFTPRQWTDNEKLLVSMTASTISGVIMRDFYNKKLEEALHKATAGSKAKSDFLSNMSHEMRTPLNAIIGMTAIGKNAADIERKNYSLTKIEDASTHLLGVINDVLDMSKIEADKFELVPTEFNFEKMLQRVVNVVNFRAEEKRQKLMVHIHKDIPKMLFGDDQRLAQVITNLLGNAVKFTPEGGMVDLDARFLSEEDSPDGEFCTIEIAVTDTGIGISKEQQKSLFQAFQQAESSTVRKYGGTGLGLSISKRIVEMMGGKIWVQSEPKKGSTFAFTIQAKRVEERRQTSRERTVDLETVRVLAVDDDPDVLAFFMDVTQRYGIHCDTAPSSKYALQFLEGSGNYDIYFIDWKMPDMDGIALTKALKEKEHKGKNNGVMTIMISSTDWSEIKDEAEKAGVNKFLSKPLFPSAIIETISECLGIEQQYTKEMQPDSAASFAGRRILLAEDVEINREIVLTLLESTELQIDCAENGKQAVEMFGEKPEKYELILMDVQMPEMDGYEATRQIRKIEKEWKVKKVPIVAMTANVFKEDIDNCINAGMDDHIGKPLDFEVFMEKLHAYLK